MRPVSTGLKKKRVNIIMEESNGNHAANDEPILGIREIRKTYMQGEIRVHAHDGVSLDEGSKL